MLKEALEYLSQLSRRAARIETVDLKDPRKLGFFIPGKNDVSATDVPPPPRDHSAGSLADFVAAVKRAADRCEDAVPVVWFNPDRVVAVLDDEGHRLETITFPLETSAAWSTLEEADGEWKTQRDFVRLLRIPLAGALPPAILLEKVRRVNFETQQTTAATIERQRESLGRTITEAAKTDGGDLPETVVLTLPRWSNRGESDNAFVVSCAVEVDAARGMFCLAAIPNAMDRATYQALEDLRGRLTAGLEGSGIPVFYGNP